MSALTQQMAFQRIRRQYSRRKRYPIITQSYLRLEADINANSTLYEFPVLESEQSNALAKPTEQRLNINDCFFVEEFAFYITVPTSLTATDYRLETYPNDTSLGAANFQQYFNLYTAFMQISVNNVMILPSYDLAKHYYCPQQQHVAAGAPFDQLDAKHHGTYYINPNIQFSGSKKNTVQLVLPNSVSTVAEFSRIVLIFRGALAQNASAFQM
jgi:hypothetical protein